MGNILVFIMFGYCLEILVLFGYFVEIGFLLRIKFELIDIKGFICFFFVGCKVFCIIL